MDAPPKLLFIPVSGRFGMGEYIRSLAIADAARSRWPSADIRFVLSSEAPYAAASPYPATLLPSSPTFHSGEVIRLIETLRPDVVVFDNAGRSAQLEAARHLGARLVYISARRRQRRRAFRLRWMRLLDEHWLAYPRFIAGDLSRFERLKLKILGRPRIRFLDVVLPRADAVRRASLLERLGLLPAGFVLFVPGGGTGHPGVGDAPGVFREAAEAVARSGVATLIVGAAEAESEGEGAHAPRPAASPTPAGAIALPLLPLADLAELMRAARVVAANGGSTLLQAIACGCAVVAAPIAGDQAERVRRCAEAGVAVHSPLEAQALAAAVRSLLEREDRRAAQAARAAALRVDDGLELAVDAIAAWVDDSRAAAGRAPAAPAAEA